MVPESRSCTKCHLIKPLAEFSKAPRGKYGRKPTCKACDAERAKAKAVSRALPPGEVQARIDARRGDTKKCTKCGEVKPRSEFHKARDGKYGPVLKSSCKACGTAAALEWFKNNQERTAENKRRYLLMDAYGITVEEYDALYAEQGGLCAICKRPERTARNGKVMRMPVDHCHETGRIRGLLCHSCNRAIGLLGDDVELLRSAIAYLLPHQAEAAG